MEIFLFSLSTRALVCLSLIFGRRADSFLYTLAESYDARGFECLGNFEGNGGSEVERD